jgi:hypothetical protein
MTAAAKQRHPVIPTLCERFTVLLEELPEAPAEEQRAILTLWQDMLNARLDALAERVRPKGEVKIDALGQSAIVGSVPAGYLRVQFDDRSRGPCACRAYEQEALKDDV